MAALTLKQYYELRQGKSDKGVLVMDGDWLVFQAMAASEIETQWDDDIWTLECDHGKAWNILVDSIKSYASRKKAWRDAPIVLAFTDAVNWRKELVDPTYKENRKASRKPVGYRAFVERVQACEDWTSILEERLEGDDVMGIIGSGAKHFGFKKAVLVSCDKDFKTIPDCDFLWCTTGNILTQDQTTADYWHIYQTIKGDLTDGYGGIPGWGETTAEWLENPYAFEQVEKTFKSGARKGQTVLEWKKVDMGERTLWEAIVTLGAKAGMTEEEIIKQGQMARILRFEEYNFIDKEIYLWSPEQLRS
ncbi:exonuclease [Erwinia phage FE44]|uniref:Exonuclease n=1 Tax=Erwinia phage FE44 TaxID=1407608 RepID=U5P070_9CAUD|nr:exonuclease [Erwinia phage FE44]AGY36926.1 exonuclease [Erwinia phage FE44]